MRPIRLPVLAVSSCAIGAAALVGCVTRTALVGDEPTLPPIVTTSTTTTTIAPATTLPQYYEVQRGDTLFEIATAFGLPVQAILEFNDLEDGDSLAAGQILAIPDRAIVASALPATVPGQTPPTIPGTSTTLANTTSTEPPIPANTPPPRPTNG